MCKCTTFLLHGKMHGFCTTCACIVLQCRKHSKLVYFSAQQCAVDTKMWTFPIFVCLDCEKFANGWASKFPLLEMRDRSKTKNCRKDCRAPFRLLLRTSTFPNKNGANGRNRLYQVIMSAKFDVAYKLCYVRLLLMFTFKGDYIMWMAKRINFNHLKIVWTYQ